MKIDESKKQVYPKKYNGKAWSVVRKGSLYVPVEFTIVDGIVTHTVVGDEDMFAASESKASNSMRVWAQS